jgi:hypothetical protein
MINFVLFDLQEFLDLDFFHYDKIFLSTISNFWIHLVIVENWNNYLFILITQNIFKHFIYFIIQIIHPNLSIIILLNQNPSIHWYFSYPYIDFHDWILKIEKKNLMTNWVYCKLNWKVLSSWKYFFTRLIILSNYYSLYGFYLPNLAAFD